MPHSPVPQLSRLVQASRPSLSRQQHNPHWPQMCQGGDTGIPQNKSPPTQNSPCGWGGEFLVNHHYGQDATHVVKTIPVPLWPYPNDHIMSKRESCWGYNYRNSMTLCLLCASTLPPPAGSPRPPEEEGRVFPALGVSQALLPPPARAPETHFGVISKAVVMEKLLVLALSLLQVCRATLPAGHCYMSLSIWAVQILLTTDRTSPNTGQDCSDSANTCWAKMRCLGLFGGTWPCPSFFKVFL